jgi:hypothetical protein
MVVFNKMNWSCWWRWWEGGTVVRWQPFSSMPGQCVCISANEFRSCETENKRTVRRSSNDLDLFQQKNIHWTVQLAWTVYTVHYNCTEWTVQLYEYFFLVCYFFNSFSFIKKTSYTRAVMWTISFFPKN